MKFPRTLTLPHRILWGVGLAMMLAVGAELMSGALSSWLDNGVSPVSPVLCAILIGVIWRNSVGIGARWLPGLEWVANTLLKAGIALVGLRLTFAGLGAAAVFALPVAIGCIVVALGTSMAIGKAFGLSRPLRFLIAAGTAVCGCTAIVAVTPVTRAKPAETGVALSCVVVLGCLGMFLYPWLANAIFPGNVQDAGVFLGTAIHDTSQVVGASLIYAEQFSAEAAPAVAAFTKLLRNLSLLVLIPLFAAWSNQGEPGAARSPAMARRSQALPVFLICFIAFAVMRTGGDALFASAGAAAWWPAALSAASKVSELLLVCGMTAVGLSVSFSDLKGMGARAFFTALLVALSVGGTSLTLIVVLERLGL